MLKLIGIVLFIFSANTFSNEYQIIVNDKLTNETESVICNNELELQNMTNYLIDLNDQNLNITIKLKNSNVEGMVKKSGGEGSGD
jgi:hypothetical protein